MGQKVRSVVIGVVLILTAAFLGLTAFYFLKVKPSMSVASKPKLRSTKPSPAVAKDKVSAKDKTAPAKAQPGKAASKSVPESKKSEPAPVAAVQGGVSLQTLVTEAEKVYSPEEKANKEGFLWIDRRNSQYVVTLGAINGVIAGKQLNVYEGSQRVGEVIVDTSFDVISYVHPSDGSKDILSGDYYRVVSE